MSAIEKIREELDILIKEDTPKNLILAYVTGILEKHKISIAHEVLETIKSLNL